MPRTYGPISLAAPPGTGSSWLHKVFGAIGLPEGDNGFRHGPGDNVTVTIVRDVDTWLRTVYARRWANLPEDMPSVNRIVQKVGLEVWPKPPGMSFDFFLERYIVLCPGWATLVFADFKAVFTLRQEDLIQGTLQMLRRLAIPHDEDVVATVPRTSVTKSPPDWPADPGLRRRVMLVG